MDLTLSPELQDELARHVEQQCQSLSLRLESCSQPAVPVDDGGIKKKLEKYIDFEAGGLKLLDLEIGGRPARFLLVPDIGKKEIWLKFQYRF